MLKQRVMFEEKYRCRLLHQNLYKKNQSTKIHSVNVWPNKLNVLLNTIFMVIMVVALKLSLLPSQNSGKVDQFCFFAILIFYRK